MKIEYFKEYSHSLNRDMEFKVYGHAGKPVLFIPCQNGRFFDFENFHMLEHFADRIEKGEVQVFSIDTIDAETYSDTYGDPRKRIQRHEAWINYICEELVPRIHSLSDRKGVWNAGPGIMTFGCSMGAMHAATLYYRRPDLFDRNLSLSGLYETTDSFGSYSDNLTYDNSPIQFLANMPANHPWMERYQNGKCVICAGTGAWEDLMIESTGKLKDVLERKNIPTWVDFWGGDVNHDWPWWYKQVAYYLPYLLDEG